MAVTGILGQELLGVSPAWYEAGAKEYDIPATPLTAIEFVVMGFLETKRYQGFKQTGTVSLRCMTAVSLPPHVLVRRPFRPHRKGVSGEESAAAEPRASRG
jgi:hypothetical protein